MRSMTATVALLAMLGSSPGIAQSTDALKRAIDELKGRMTILIVAHRLSTVRNADRIYVLHQGQIVEEGPWKDLLALPQGRFRRMCELQEVAS